MGEGLYQTAFYIFRPYLEIIIIGLINLLSGVLATY